MILVKRCVFELSWPTDLHFLMAIWLLGFVQVAHGAFRLFNGLEVVLSVRDEVILDDETRRSITHRATGKELLEVRRGVVKLAELGQPGFFTVVGSFAFFFLSLGGPHRTRHLREGFGDCGRRGFGCEF